MPKYGKFVDQTAFTAFHPTVTQSGPVTSFSTDVCYYKQVGKLVTAFGRLVVNNAGTAAGANDIVITLPVTALFTGAAAVRIGTGAIADVSATTIYFGQAQMISATTFKLMSDMAPLATGGALYLGSKDMTAGLATGDFVDFSIQYEAA